MNEKQVFVDSPFGSVPEHILCLCFCVFLWVGNSFLPEPLPTNVLIIFFAGLYFLVLVVPTFERKLTVTCDSTGCEVHSKNFWQRVGKTYFFKWSDVTETKFARFTYSTRTKPMFFWIVVDGEAKRLLRRHWFTADMMNSFVELVNQATPHLPYVWTKDETNLEVLEKVGRFKKVRRNNVGLGKYS